MSVMDKPITRPMALSKRSRVSAPAFLMFTDVTVGVMEVLGTCRALGC